MKSNILTEPTLTILKETTANHLPVSTTDTSMGGRKLNQALPGKGDGVVFSSFFAKLWQLSPQVNLEVLSTSDAA